MAWYKRLRIRRINRWIANGFSRVEAITLSALKSTNKYTGRTTTVTIPVTRSYAQTMMQARMNIYRKAERDGVSNAEHQRRVHAYYESNGWITPEGKPDYWAEIRHYQEQSDYEWHGRRPPYDPSKPHKKKTEDGGIDYRHTRRQATSYRDRDKGMGKPPQISQSQWIEQLRQGIRNTANPYKRAQLRQQILNLGGTP